MPTAPTFPFSRRVVAIAGRAYAVETVDDQDALLAAADERDRFPFGLMLWEGAVALAEEVAARADTLADRTVLELGAGLGLTGVVAASLGARVTQTDHDEASLAACARTAALNGVAGIARRPGDWHAWTLDNRYDLVLGADVTYDGDDHAAVLAILSRNLAPGGTALLSDPMRAMQEPFMTAARAAGFEVTRTQRTVPDLTPPHPGATRAIAILELRPLRV